jgi:hypothetical protein
MPAQLSAGSGGTALEPPQPLLQMAIAIAMKVKKANLAVVSVEHLFICISLRSDLPPRAVRCG